MSAAEAKRARKERVAEDFYPTPGWATRAILPHLHRSPVFDPCAGEGALLREVSGAWNDGQQSRWFVGLEINSGRVDRAIQEGWEVWERDALSADSWQVSPDRQVIMNPPFSLALEFVERALVESRFVSALLRLGFLGSKKRVAFHRAHPADVYVFPRRPSFSGGRTDQTEYAWFCWGPGRGGRWSILDLEAAR